MNKFHELSYTLENALLRITEEVNLMAENLEEVHLASERMDPETITARGAAYLQASQIISAENDCP